MKIESVIKYCKKKLLLADNDEDWKAQKKHYKDILEWLNECQRLMSIDDSSVIDNPRKRRGAEIWDGKCHKCEFIVNSEWDFCPRCGRPLVLKLSTGKGHKRKGDLK